MTPALELYQDQATRDVLQRGAALWHLLNGDPRFAYYGTTVSLCDPGDDVVEQLIALARLQGRSMAFYVPETREAEILRGLTQRGFSGASSLFCRGEDDAYTACKAYIAARPLPEDLRLVRLTCDTPEELMRQTVELIDSCGLSSAAGGVMRGLSQAGATFVAVDRRNRPVATAAASLMHAPSSPRTAEAFWGVLATRADHRKRGLASYLGAQALVYMWETHGIRAVCTGIKADNTASLHVCRALGVRPTSLRTIFCGPKAA